MRRMSASLAGLLFLECLTPCWGQETGVTKLNIVIVEGEGAINNVRQRTARAPIVQVEDQNRRPVAGAVVVFMLPERGATGVFPNGSRTLTVMTDSQGRAVANGIRPETQGQMQINVTASYQGVSASGVLSQTNVMGAAAGGAAGMSGALKWLIVLGAAGAAAATGAVIATRSDNGNGGSTSTVRPPVSVSPGAGTVGPPR
jgi:hypothetical protein